MDFENSNKIFSPGKLLLTSEYFVLDGALALAVPTKLGQEFFFEEIIGRDSEIIWEAYHQEVLWLKIKINYRNWTVLEANLADSAAFIVKVLQNVQDLSKIRFQSENSYFFKTNLQFPADFGLGSSSTLMNNLAEWAEIDAFQLNEISLGGSGYDIAVAKEKSAILFQNLSGEKVFQKIDFNPSFKDYLIFIHLNQKQDSREGINHYRSKEKSPELIQEFSSITNKVLKADNLEDFSQLMQLHEQKLANFLEIQPVKEKYFENYGGFVKSLGAWGGDFVLASKFGDYKSYFQHRNFDTIFEWNDLIN